jgi:hypothetical protein
VLRRGVGAIARVVTGDAADDVADDTTMEPFVIVRSVARAGAGAGAINVAHAAAAGRVL